MTEERTCQNCKSEFTIESEDFGWYEKFKVPPPTWCPSCRFFRRALFRNERKLFKSTNPLNGKPMLSFWPPESGFTVYPDKDFWSQEAWDPLQYGRDFDPSRPFLEQLLELFKKVPKMATFAINMVNSEYSGNADGLKNCYLLFNSNHTEDSAYGNGVDFSSNCYDNSHVQKSQQCYNSFWLTNCYQTHYSAQCEDCINVWFSKNCRSCADCFGCVNMRSKKYCIFNEQYSKEEYEKRLAEMALHRWQGIQPAGRRAHAFWLTHPNKSMQGVQNNNVSGEYITHSKNVHKSYLIRECENLKYVQYSQVPSSRDCMDASLIGSKSELFYEVAVSGWNAADLKFCWDCWDGGRQMEYSIDCHRNGANLFGCVGIMDQQYCILNKQYSKEEYAVLRERIIKHMNDMPYVDKKGRVYKYGEFFPPEFSPFAYQHTIVPEHFTMTREEVEAFGARWQDPNPTEYQTTMPASAIPDSIKDVSDDILKEIIQCENCKRAYRLIQPELQFLKQLGIPAPRTCVDCRHSERIAQRNKSKLYARRCGCAGQKSESGIYTNTAKHFHSTSSCSNEFETSYAPERPEIVYCESCYNAEVA
ncbi:MAG: hypothetical protein A2946_00050 [Candidatus Liptonbacteria bacterium RIFCSPLOWO2_01_FULL_53_13]|uniref:Uncharacterized protein n=1 Tax=Candidatus Liptonbacteria bacterium RIFCSPLOWO2_01_FULL_53_13 TaxID=1798651 RepID=A0A1G2CLL6_9BACT|nr:MAG: hypothetical protein A2946_00050 [Candidatus Liptonbacteria bacterium RIFCSPLOWO2_01_FULL_53_13]